MSSLPVSGSRLARSVSVISSVVSPQRAQWRQQPARLPGGDQQHDAERQYRHDRVGPQRPVELGVLVEQEVDDDESALDAFGARSLNRHAGHPDVAVRRVVEHDRAAGPEHPGHRLPVGRQLEELVAVAVARRQVTLLLNPARVGRALQPGPGVPDEHLIVVRDVARQEDLEQHIRVADRPQRLGVHGVVALELAELRDLLIDLMGDAGIDAVGLQDIDDDAGAGHGQCCQQHDAGGDPGPDGDIAAPAGPGSRRGLSGRLSRRPRGRRSRRPVSSHRHRQPCHRPAVSVTEERPRGRRRRHRRRPHCHRSGRRPDRSRPAPGIGGVLARLLGVIAGVASVVGVAVAQDDGLGLGRPLRAGRQSSRDVGQQRKQHGQRQQQQLPVRHTPQHDVAPWAPMSRT